MMTLPLGKVYNQELALRRTVVTRQPTKVRESRSRSVGSCARLTTPNPAGLTGSLWFRSQSQSRCSASGYYATFARQGLSVIAGQADEPGACHRRLRRLPRPSLRFTHRKASASCLLSHKSAVWHDYPRLSRARGWHRLCGRTYTGYSVTDSWGPDRGDRVMAGFEVANGARLDLQRVRVTMTYLQCRGGCTGRGAPADSRPAAR